MEQMMGVQQEKVPQKSLKCTKCELPRNMMIKAQTVRHNEKVGFKYEWMCLLCLLHVEEVIFNCELKLPKLKTLRR